MINKNIREKHHKILQIQIIISVWNNGYDSSLVMGMCTRGLNMTNKKNAINFVKNF